MSKGVYSAIFPEQRAKDRRAFRQGRLTPSGLALLPKIARRSQRRHVEPPAAGPTERPRVTAVRSANCSNAPEHCGDATAIPGTPLWRVTVENSCGDACYTQYQLYDPRTLQFIDLADSSHRRPLPLAEEWDELADFYVAPDGSALLAKGQIFRLNGKSIMAGAGLGGGWLGGGWHVM